MYKSKILPFIVCFSASLIFFYQFILGNMFPSIADNLMQDFHLNAHQMSFLSSAYYFSNVLFLFVSGYILDHYSTRKTLLIAMLVCVISTFVFSVSDNYDLLLICRLFSGISSAFCFIGPIRVASRWYPPQKMAMITGLIVTFAMSGGILSQYPLTKLVEWVGWRSAVQDIGWFGLVLWFGMFLGVKESKQYVLADKKTLTEIISTLKSIYTNSVIMKAALYTSLMNMVVAVFGAMMGTLYLMQRLSIVKSQASLINSMLFFGAIIGGPLVGWISDKICKRVMPMKIFAVLSLWLIIIVLYFPLTPMMMAFLFFGIGLVTSAQVISYGWVAENSVPQMTAMAISAISVMTQGGYVIYQNLYSSLLMYFNQNSNQHYTLHAYQMAALMMPIGIGLAYFLISGLRDHKVTHE